MDQATKILQTSLGQAMSSTLGALLVFAAIFLLVLLLVMPLYMLLRRGGSGGPGVSFQIGSGNCSTILTSSSAA